MATRESSQCIHEKDKHDSSFSEKKPLYTTQKDCTINLQIANRRIVRVATQGDPYADNPHLQAARNYIRSAHFHEAINLLEGMKERSAEWYYLSGEAQLGLGNRMAALNYARQAVSMNPNSFEYRALLNRVEGNTRFYQTGGDAGGFTMPTMMCGNPLLSCCMLNLLCNCCCPGRFLYC